jgi:hypothetical protein
VPERASQHEPAYTPRVRVGRMTPGDQFGIPAERIRDILRQLQAGPHGDGERLVAQVCWYLRAPFICIRSGSNRTQNSPDNDYRKLSPFAPPGRRSFTVSLLASSGAGPPMKLFSRGDVDGFCAIALDNIVQLLLIPPLCIGVLGFRPALVYGRILPGVAVSFLVGNLFYAWQAHRLARRENRDDVCAIPFGLNTPTLIAYIFLVMAPARQIAIAHGAADPDVVAWRIGLVACVGSGLIEFFGAFVAGRIRSITPRAALLASLSGAGLAFLTMNFMFSTFAHPIVGFVTLGLVLLFYFGELKPRGGIPPALVVLACRNGARVGHAPGAPGGPRPVEMGWRPPAARRRPTCSGAWPGASSCRTCRSSCPWGS